MAKVVNNQFCRLGLDIGSHAVKGVEIMIHDSEPTIRAIGSVPIQRHKDKYDACDQSATISAVKRLIALSGFSTKQVYLALPSDKAYMKWLHLEAENDEDRDSASRAVAVRGAPFPADEAIVDYDILYGRMPVSPNSKFMMLAAAHEKDVDELLTIAEEAGLEPVGVDIGIVAALRSIESKKIEKNLFWSGQPKAHCLLGSSATTVAVVRDGDIEFCRSFPVGGRDFTLAIMQALDLKWDVAEELKVSPGTKLREDGTILLSMNGGTVSAPCDNVVGRLAREIQRSIQFFSAQFAEGSYLGMVGAMTISGGGALLKGLQECFRNEGIEIASEANPFSGYRFLAERSIQRGASLAPQMFTTAMGLALSEANIETRNISTAA